MRGMFKIKDRYFEWNTVTDSVVGFGRTREEWAMTIFKGKTLGDIKRLSDSMDICDTDEHTFAYCDGVDELLADNMFCPDGTDLTQDEIYEKFRLRPAGEPVKENGCESWRAFLDVVLPGAHDQDLLRNWIQKALRVDKYAPLLGLCGDGVGKSVVVHVIAGLFGPRFCTYFDMSEVDGRRLEVFSGAFLNISEHVGRVTNERACVVRGLLSGSKFVINKKGEDPYQEDLRVRFVFTSNETPAKNRETFKRLHKAIMLPFDATLTGGKMNPHLVDMLLEEIDGILAWAMRGGKNHEYQSHHSCGICDNSKQGAGEPSGLEVITEPTTPYGGGEVAKGEKTQVTKFERPTLPSLSEAERGRWLQIVRNPDGSLGYSYLNDWKNAGNKHAWTKDEETRLNVRAMGFERVSIDIFGVDLDRWIRVICTDGVFHCEYLPKAEETESEGGDV